jgi:pimeloyl-ACP methyl ester carboxylesterase
MPQISLDNVCLYYETTGQGQPLVFINGLGSSTRDWDMQVTEFSRTYQVITYDLRGHGRSDKPAGPYSIPQFAADSAGLLKALGVTSAHIVGISLGGGVAFQLALDYPQLVKTMTIVNSAPAMVGITPDAQKEVERRVAIVRQMGMRAMGEALGPALFPKPEHAALCQTFVERWAENDPQAYIEATLSMVGWNVTDRLSSIRCPTLVIAADQDYTPVAIKEAYVKLLPDAQLVVIADAHHATPVERPQEFNAVLAPFLARHS